MARPGTLTFLFLNKLLSQKNKKKRAHMTSRSDCEPLPKPTLSPSLLRLRARVPFSVSVFSLPQCGVCLLCGYRWFIL
jgi:hypothetical protein